MAEKEYIEREAAMNALKQNTTHFGERIRAVDAIQALPAADVREVKRGRWENVEPNFMAKCSNCRRYYISRDEKYDFHFCPSCGADMREEQT